MYFLGVDLAWGHRNSSAVVILSWDGAAGVLEGWSDRLGDDEEIVQFIAKAVEDEPALGAIDAPLVVPNEEGTRSCDRELTRAYAWAEAGTYPANRRRLGPLVRGEVIIAGLQALGFTHSPAIAKGEKSRKVVEVYPHPAMVELFGLERTLKYKARPRRSYQDRWQEFSRYIELLRSLSLGIPQLSAEDILSINPEGLRGQTLKRLEDLLDALFCGYIALHLWYHGGKGYRRFGDLATGYIIVPIHPNSPPAFIRP